MQYAPPRQQVPNSAVIENLVRHLTCFTVNSRYGSTTRTILRKLVDGLNKEYGIRLTQKELKGRKSLQIAGIVQKHMFALQKRVPKKQALVPMTRLEPQESDPAEPLAEKRMPTLTTVDVARVIADALNKEYSFSMTPYDIGSKSVSQLCNEVVMNIYHRAIANEV